MSKSVNLPRNISAFWESARWGPAAWSTFRGQENDILAWGRDSAKLAQLPHRVATLHAWLDEHRGSAAQPLGKLTLCERLEQLDESADVVLECVSKVLDVKAQLFRKLASVHHRREIMVLSTTSGLSITEMGRQSNLEHLLVGASF